MKESWRQIPEIDSRFPKWLRRVNLQHEFSYALFVNDTCGCAQIRLEGEKPNPCACPLAIS